MQLAAYAFQIVGGSLKVDKTTVNVSYANPGAFLPVYGSSEWAVSADTPEGFVVYRDDQAFASEYSPRIEAQRLKQQQEEEARRLAEERERLQQQQEESKKEAGKGNYEMFGQQGVRQQLIYLH